MSKRRLALVTAVALAAASLTACGGSSDSSSSSGTKTLTYWASNQGTEPRQRQDRSCSPSWTSSTQQTGIKVNLEVVRWSDLLNRILAATTSGKGPDVLNIGNTWSASLQATGALLPFDDATHRRRSAARTASWPAASPPPAPPGKPPAAVPIYSLAYGLYYNKKMFADAGIAGPADHLGRAGRRRQEADQGRPVGPRRRGRATSPRTSTTRSPSASSTAADCSTRPARPTFDTPQNVAAIKRYIDFMAERQDRQPEQRRVRAEPVGHRLRQRQGRDAAVAGRRLAR